MAKPKLNYFISILMIISFLAVGVTSIILDDDWSIENEIIVNMHHAFGIIFLVLIVIHLLFHIKFITAMTKNLFAKKN